jgi:hypothetical protein
MSSPRSLVLLCGSSLVPWRGRTRDHASAAPFSTRAQSLRQSQKPDMRPCVRLGSRLSMRPLSVPVCLLLTSSGIDRPASSTTTAPLFQEHGSRTSGETADPIAADGNLICYPVSNLEPLPAFFKMCSPDLLVDLAIGSRPSYWTGFPIFDRREPFLALGRFRTRLSDGREDVGPWFHLSVRQLLQSLFHWPLSCTS